VRLPQVKQQYKEKYWDKIDRDLAVQLGCLDIRWVELCREDSFVSFIFDHRGPIHRRSYDSPETYFEIKFYDILMAN